MDRAIDSSIGRPNQERSIGRRRLLSFGRLREHRLTPVAGEAYPCPRADKLGGTAMKWKTPVIVEIAVGLEINAYACAEI
jgi:coenzyme PQQ precursor peptide PqqA